MLSQDKVSDRRGHGSAALGVSVLPCRSRKVFRLEGWGKSRAGAHLCPNVLGRRSSSSLSFSSTSMGLSAPAAGPSSSPSPPPLAAASGGGDGEEDGPAAGALNPMDVDENDSDDEDLLPSTFGQRCAPARLFPQPSRRKTFLDRHGRTDTPRAAEPWPLRSLTLSCDSTRHACPRTGPATRQVQCAPSGYRVARHRIRRRLVPRDSFVRLR